MFCMKNVALKVDLFSLKQHTPAAYDGYTSESVSQHKVDICDDWTFHSMKHTCITSIYN